MEETHMSHRMTCLPERTNRALLKIIRDNFKTQYVTQAAPLSEFRDAVALHGTSEINDVLLMNFRTYVPLSDWGSYIPFAEKFNNKPCKEEDVKDMFSPGLPDFLVVSSATTGTSPKIFPKYKHNAISETLLRRIFDGNGAEPLAAVISTAYRDVKQVEDQSGDITQKIPVCHMTGGLIRRALGWYIDDENQLSLNPRGCAVPWAATAIEHLPSFTIIHGLFFLARRELTRFYMSLATVFIDLIRHIDEYWDVLVSSIREGMIPDLDGINHTRKHLQAHFHANPERAAELREIGPPSSLEGWFAKVWPNVREITMVCSGQFAVVLPKVRSILGPNISINGFVYGASEAAIGFPYANKLDEFVLESDDVVEFLDISQVESHVNLRQAWEVKIGEQYEPVLTTRDGLWRYRLGDIVSIIGFDTKSNAPVFKYCGRRSLTIRLPYLQITADQLLAAIHFVNSEDVIRVQEFTTTIDNRTLLPTVGFFVELAGPVGPNGHLAPRKLFDAFVAANSDHEDALKHGKTCLPTVRIVKAGTFTEYRHWKSQTANVPHGQIKIPLVLLNLTMEEWIMERVVQEL